MDFIQSETRINLARSFAGESQARNRYTVYAKIARKEGYEWLARVFEETPPTKPSTQRNSWK